jgi:hypothetical protein
MTTYLVTVGQIEVLVDSEDGAEHAQASILEMMRSSIKTQEILPGAILRHRMTGTPHFSPVTPPETALRKYLREALEPRSA